MTDREQQAVLDGAPDTADVQEVKELHRAGMLSAERAATIVRTAMTNNKELEQQRVCALLLPAHACTALTCIGDHHVDDQLDFGCHFCSVCLSNTHLGDPVPRR